MSYIDYKHLLEFNESEYDIINSYCKKLNIKWTVSVWDIDSVNFIKKYIKDIPFIKIPSACITDIELLTAVKNLGIPVIMSNGMSSQEEVDIAVNVLSNSLEGIMHCNSSYPASIDELDLNVINQYKRMYPTLKIGYSGHERGILPSIVAASMDADIIERHITLDKNMEGTDHQSSLDQYELSKLINLIDKCFIIKGGEKLKIYSSEIPSKLKLRRF